MKPGRTKIAPLCALLAVDLVLMSRVVLASDDSPMVPDPPVVADVAGAPDSSTPPARADSLADMSLESLMELEVTSVSKKAERLADSPAAVYVVTNEEIRRSGATHVAEALRMVPGIQVAQISANRWAISARGFNSDFANKLLVLIDGRSVYSPLYSGVFWDVQDVMLEDVDRIEVIRGPGATLWGANAVNGVINVITRSADETEGGLLAAVGGTHERSAALRYGAKLGPNANFRVHGKYANRRGYADAGGRDAEDEWQIGRGGARLDWNASEDDLVTIQGDFYKGEVGERHYVVKSIIPASQPVLDEDVPVEGWNTLGRWTHRFSDSSEATFQTYFDRTERNIEFGSEDRNTVDLDFQHRFALFAWNEVVWGAGYRWTDDNTRGSMTLSFNPGNRSNDVWSGFIQDKVEIIRDVLSFTLGSKFEYNDYTGFEYQPSVRALFRPHEFHTLWGSISRAVRTPSRADDDVVLIQDVTDPDGPLLSQVTQLTGDRNFASEKLLAYELGYRFHPRYQLYLDVAGFVNVYHDLRSIELISIDPVSVPGAVLINNRFDNRFDGTSMGFEIAGNWSPRTWLQLSLSYSFIDIDLDSNGSRDPITKVEAEGSTPKHSLHLRSFIDLPGNFEFDTLFYWIDELPDQDVDSYLRLDTRLAWRPREDLVVSLVMQNLTQDKHREWGDTTLWPSSKIERSFYGKVEWQF